MPQTKKITRTPKLDQLGMEQRAPQRLICGYGKATTQHVSRQQQRSINAASRAMTATDRHSRFNRDFDCLHKHDKASFLRTIINNPMRRHKTLDGRRTLL